MLRLIVFRSQTAFIYSVTACKLFVTKCLSWSTWNNQQSTYYQGRRHLGRDFCNVDPDFIPPLHILWERRGGTRRGSVHTYLFQPLSINKPLDSYAIDSSIKNVQVKGYIHQKQCITHEFRTKKKQYKL